MVQQVKQSLVLWAGVSRQADVLIDRGRAVFVQPETFSMTVCLSRPSEGWGRVDRLCLAVPLSLALPDRCKGPQDGFQALRWPKPW